MTVDRMEKQRGQLAAFEHALEKLSAGYHEGRFCGRRWGVTVKRSLDGRRIWLYGEQLGGTDIVSFNLYRAATAGPMLKPCEMSSAKVVDFVLGFEVDRDDRPSNVDVNISQ